MKILLINGSPKGKRSNSLRLAKAFVEGLILEQTAVGTLAELEEMDLSLMKIDACIGCFTCWNKTPGICCINDDMRQVIEKQLWADVIIWSFPLYFFNVPGILKNLIDRQLPMSLPFMSERDDGYGSGGHDSRYDMSGKRHVLISTCGFYSAEGNYDSVRNMFDHFLGVGNYATIFCGQGELFRVKELSSRTDEYLTHVKQAGCEFARGSISERTTESLRQLLFPKEVFERMADASWGVSKESGEKEADDLTFTRQMAALYNKESYDGKDRVLEMCYTDLGHTYQILLGKDGSHVYTDGSLKATTRIDTPFHVWASIAQGEIEGSEALGRHMYTVSGDFSLMINWDRFFGNLDIEMEGTRNEMNGASKQKPPIMLTMLVPWIAFWSATASNPAQGAFITLGIIAILPFLVQKHRMIFWDRLSMAVVAVLSVVTHLTGEVALMTNATYLCFGMMWLGSCFMKAPLCAEYVKYDYGGESAIKNSIFMKTNYILAAGWGILYTLMAVWTWVLQSDGGISSAVLLLNNLAPAAMGIFTIWFQKWYPAWVARGGRKRSNYR